MLNLRSPLFFISTVILFIAGCSADDVLLEATFTVNPSSVDFGYVNVRETERTRVRIRNLTDKPMSVAITPNAEYEAFDVIPRSVELGAQGDTEVELTFTPNGAGLFAGTFTVTGSGGSASKAIDVRGLGGSQGLCGLAIDPTSVSFGLVDAGSTKTLPVRVRSQCDRDITVSLRPQTNTKICTDATDPSLFCAQSQSRTAGTDGSFTLAAGAEEIVDVKFSPTTAGLRERGNFVIATCDDPACETAVALDGLSGEGGITCLPGSVQFGSVPVGTCASQFVRCENPTNLTKTITGWSISPSGPGSADFEAGSSRNVVLGSGSNVDINIRYCPSSVGNHTARLDVQTDDPEPRIRTRQIPIAGTGCGASLVVQPESLDFGLVSLIAPAQRSILVTNVGLQPVAIFSVFADADQTGAFSLAGDNVGELLPGDATAIEIMAVPQVEGRVRSRLLIDSTDACFPQLQVPLEVEGIDLPPCVFELSSPAIDFFDVPLGSRAEAAIEFRNIGTADCLITSNRLSATSASEFELPDPITSTVILPAGQSRTIRAAFSPLVTSQRNGELLLGVSNPSTPQVSIPLHGSGANVTLIPSPQVVTFADTVVGCGARSQVVQLLNPGTTPATITEIGISSGTHPEFSITQGLTLPLTLAPGETTQFSVDFRPPAVSEFAAAVRINATIGGASTSVIVTLLGNGTRTATTVDDFTYASNTEVDYLFVVDRGIGMGPVQAALATSFADFDTEAMNAGVDYRIAVTTAATNPEFGRFVHPSGPTDLFGGPLANRVISATTLPSPGAVFATNVQVGTAMPGNTTDHAGFEAARLAMSAPNIVGHNAGFLRPTAALAMVFVANTDDASTNTVDFYRNFLLSIKGFRNSHLFKVAAVVGDSPSGCNGRDGTASSSPRYISMAAQMNGVFDSVCGPNWSSVFRQLALTTSANVFALSNQPVISTLEVYVGGVLVPATTAGGSVNWQYDFATNSVTFFSPQPAGASIRIEYTSECL